MTDSFSSSVWTTIATVATVTGVSVCLLQLDAVSRFLIGPKRLQSKRRASYKYRWTKALQKTTYEKRLSYNYFHDAIPELLTLPDEIQQLIDLLLKKETIFDVVAMQHDVNDTRALQELYLFLVVNQTTKYQVSLVDFGLALADKMEELLTSTALCFVADASSGRGIDTVARVVEESHAGVVVIREPLWMTFLADICNRNVIAKTKMERILFGFCRLEAHVAPVESARTVLITLPGQACTPVLIPLLQSALPCERHVFVYSGCVASVQYAYSTQGLQHLSASTPLSFLKLRGLPEALAKLPISQAGTVEAWMSAVHIFLNLKEREKETNYLPFVLKLSNLLESNEKELALKNVMQYITGSRSRPLPDGIMDAAVESLKDIVTLNSNHKRVHTKAIENCVFLHKGILIENKTLVDTVTPAKEWTLKAAKRISGCLCCAPEEDDDEEEEDGTMMNPINNNNIDMTMPGAFAAPSRPKYVDGKTAFAFDPTKFG